MNTVLEAFEDAARSRRRIVLRSGRDQGDASSAVGHGRAKRGAAVTQGGGRCVRVDPLDLPTVVSVRIRDPTSSLQVRRRTDGAAQRQDQAAAGATGSSSASRGMRSSFWLGSSSGRSLSRIEINSLDEKPVPPLPLFYD